MAIAHVDQAEAENLERKLASWKSIAEYFDCDQRTAKRWERERGLPVHRAPGGKRSAVFAYRAELDSWLHASARQVAGNARTGAAAIESPTFDGNPGLAESSPLPPARRVPRLPLWLTAGVFILLLAAAFYLVSKQLHAPLAGASVAGLPAGAPQSHPAAAEDLYLQARYFWNLRTAESLSKAIDDYTQTIVIDPNYAEAYAGLAESYELLPEFAQGDWAEDLVQGERAADRAIQLNPNLAAAHRAKAFALFFWDWDIAGSDAEFRRALALDPNSAQTHQWYSSVLLERFEGAECLKQISEARRLDPTSAAIAAEAALMHAEFDSDPGAGERMLRDLERTQPTLLSLPGYLAAIDFASGDFPAYIADLQRLASVSRNTGDLAMADAAARGWARAGKAGLLIEVLEVRKQAFQRGTGSGFDVGQMYLMLGKPREALPYFQAAFDKHFIAMINLSDCSWASTLKSDPGYAALAAQIRARLHGISPAHPQVIPVSYRLPL